ncbi:T9SS type A sorting domain-containing protein [Lentimicrobium sp. S6]|uniref:T9SS type A sorting domain-containing protein n=1 Tax=Lentimicrobium sp. S6 TaxID=2735872 RepID=UPI0015529C79|nr:T9SS type A sorting domain-containing protein [Lentimicrobium sp. S6]NPD48251.1 T9SS type A sorting domain-containing protein [Lentimicrobium sp. S6]
MAHVIERRYQVDDEGYSTEFNIAAWYAEFNGSGFDWDLTEIPVDLAMRTGGDHPGTTKNKWTFGNAWSNNGSVGYTWMIGVDANLDDEGGYSPIVFKTENQGQDWEQIEIDLADNEVMSEYLWATGGFEGPMWPNVSELDGVADNEGKLQLFVKATGTFSSHTDSVGWTYSNNLDYIFNLDINMNGVQNVYFVDSLLAEDLGDESTYGFGTESWGSRLRATRTEDGTAVFAVWCDTENPEDFEGGNGAPNIKAGGRFVNGGDFTDFPVTNFTSDDLYAGFYFYHNVGQISIIEDNFVHIPVVTSVTSAEFNAGNESDPVTHSYVKGVKFPWTVGLNKLEAVSNIAVSQNSPNPFTDATTIELTSAVSAPVLIEVSNLMGQTVYTLNPGIINNTMKIELPARDLQSGVYFYTVTIANESVSKKMIVE